MSNTTEQASPRFQTGAKLECDKRLHDSLAAAVAHDEQSDMQDSGLAFEWREEGGKHYLYPFFPYGVNLDRGESAMSAIDVLGGIIGANGLDYMEFGLGFHTDRCLPGGFGGCEFRIHSDGGVSWSRSLFPEDCLPLLEEAEGVLDWAARECGDIADNCTDDEDVRNYTSAFERNASLAADFAAWRTKHGL